MIRRNQRTGELAFYRCWTPRPVADLGHRLRWSIWRRRHQARARTCHYRRQAA
jgi:hypothetical protein